MMRFLSRLKSAASRATLSRSIPALFVLSTGRAGTTMLKDLLALCDKVTAVHELRPYLYDLRRELYLTNGFTDRHIVRRVLNGERLNALRAAQSNGNLFVDTSPFLSFCAPALHAHFPNAKFVYLHRTPEEVVCSGMRRGWYERHGYDRFRLTPKQGSQASTKWDSWSRFQKISWLWKETNATCLRCFNELEPERRLELPCREFWGSPRDSVEKLLAFLEIGAADIPRLVERLRHPSNVQKGKNFDAPEKWPPRLWAQMWEIVGPVAQQLGYANRNAEAGLAATPGGG